MFQELVKDSQQPNIYFYTSHGDLFIKLPIVAVEEITEDDLLAEGDRTIGATFYLGEDKANKFEVFIDFDISKVKHPLNVPYEETFEFCYRAKHTNKKNTFYIVKITE